MNIYVASQYARRDEMRQVRSKLISRGHSVTSRWLDENEPLNAQMGQQTTEWYRQTAFVDLYDIQAADVVLFFSEDPLVGIPRGGRHVEFGYALGRGMRVDVIGPKENIFHYVGKVTHYNCLEDYLAAH